MGVSYRKWWGSPFPRDLREGGGRGHESGNVRMYLFQFILLGGFIFGGFGGLSV